MLLKISITFLIIVQFAKFKFLQKEQSEVSVILVILCSHNIAGRTCVYVYMHVHRHLTEGACSGLKFAAFDHYL